MVYEPISLASRLESQHLPTDRSTRLNRWTLTGPSGYEFELGLPAYSRMLRHVEWEDGLPDHLISGFASYGIPWIGVPRANWHNQPMRVAALAADDPVDVTPFQAASAVQFQFFGQSQPSHQTSSYSYWKSSTPLEIGSPEQMTKKVAAVRTAIPENLPIGAAVIAHNQTIYEDVRLLIDCGFDFIELIAGSITQLKPDCWIEFESDISSCVNLAAKARRDARGGTKLWLSAPLTHARDWLPLLRSGIDACCIDAFVASRRPTEQRASASFAGIKVSTQSKFEWVVGVLREFQNSFLDIHNFYSP